MAIKLASLFIEIAADGGKLTAELVKSRNQANDWSRQVGKAADFAKKSFVAVGVGAGIATAGLTAVYLSSSQALDELGKTAAKLGDTTENLRTFGLAAEFGGVGTDVANKALQRMTDGLSDAAQGTGEAKNAIRELGLDAQRLARLRPSEAFEEITTALETIPLASDRVRIAMDFFGTRGASLVNVTRDVLQKAKDDVEAFGGAVSSIEVAQVEAANDSVTRLQTGFGLLTDKLTVKLAPAVKAVADQLFESATQGEQLDGVLDDLVLGALSGFTSVVSVVGESLRLVDGRSEIATYGVIGYMFFGKKGLLLGGALGAVSDSLKDTFDVVRISFDDSATALQKTTAEIDRLESKLQTRQTPVFSFLFGDEGDANIQARIDELKEQQRGLQSFAASSIEALSGTGSFASAAADGFDGLAMALQGVIQNYGALAETEANDILIEPAGIPTPASPFAVTPVTISNGPDAANDEAPAASDEEEPRDLRAEYFAEQLAAEKQFQDTWTLFQQSGSKDRLQILFNETSGALQTLAQHSRTFFEINRAASLANATVSIATGISRALSLPFPANLGAAATVALQGVAQIKTITSAKFGQGDVASVSGSSSPTSDTSSAGGVSGSSIDNLQSDQYNDQVGLRPIIFTTPGASREQKAAEVAQSLARAAELDLYQVDANGLPIYNGSEDLDLAV